MITDHVIFSSPYFKVQPGEDEETNPGIYGRSPSGWPRHCANAALRSKE